MGNYNRDNRSRDRGGYSKPEMHSAICDECGKECQVPFKPSGDKPIYCSECFEKKGGGSERRNDRRPSLDRKPSFSPNGSSVSTRKIEEQLELLNKNMEKIVEALTTKTVRVLKKTTAKKKASSKK